MASKPASLPRWADGGSAAVTEPSSGKKDLGWEVDERPAAQYFNWWMELVYNWMQYLNDGALSGAHSIAGNVDITGTLDVSDLVTATKGVTWPTRVSVISAALDGVSDNGSFSIADGFWQASASSQRCYLPLSFLSADINPLTNHEYIESASFTFYAETGATKTLELVFRDPADMAAGWQVVSGWSTTSILGSSTYVTVGLNGTDESLVDLDNGFIYALRFTTGHANDRLVSAKVYHRRGA